MLALGACLELAPSPGRKNKVLEINFLNFSYLFFGVNFENLTVEIHVPMFLTYVSNFVQIGCYLLFDQLTYFLYTTLDHKNLKL